MPWSLKNRASNSCSWSPTNSGNRSCRCWRKYWARRSAQDELVAWLDFGVDRAAERTWVIDPIDGTKGFLARRHYVVAVGLLRAGQVSEGIVAAPGYGEGAGALFYTRDGATWRAPLSAGAGVKVSVSQRHKLQEYVVVQSYERYHASKSRMARARDYAGLGGARLVELDSMEKYALVAAGDADLYMRLPREGSAYAHKIWDHAAGVALVQNAGGTVTDIDGGPLDFSQGETLPNAGLIASNGSHHAHVVDAVQRVMTE